MAVIPRPTLTKLEPSTFERGSTQLIAPPAKSPRAPPMFPRSSLNPVPSIPIFPSISPIPPTTVVNAIRPAPKSPILTGKDIGINAPAVMIPAKVIGFISDKAPNTPVTIFFIAVASREDISFSPVSKSGRILFKMAPPATNTPAKAIIPAAREPIPFTILPAGMFNLAIAIPPPKTAAMVAALMSEPVNASVNDLTPIFITEVSRLLIPSMILTPLNNESTPANNASAATNVPANATIPAARAPIPLIISLGPTFNAATAAPVPITAISVASLIPSKAPNTVFKSFAIDSPGTSANVPSLVVMKSPASRAVAKPVIPAPTAVIPKAIFFAIPFLPKATTAPAPIMANNVAVSLIPSNAPKTFWMSFFIELPSIPAASPNFAIKSPAIIPRKKPEIPIPRAVIPLISLS